MCYVITIAVPGSVAQAVRAAHAGRGMDIAPTANPAAVRAACGMSASGAGSGRGRGARAGKEHRVPLLVTGGGCSCAWYTVPPPSGRAAAEQDARARARYQRMGWSAAKIERALASATRAPRPGDGLHAVVVELLRAIVTAHGSAAVWVHDFSGDVETEAYAIAAHVECTLDELQSRASGLAVDTVLEVHASPGK